MPELKIFDRVRAQAERAAELAKAAGFSLVTLADEADVDSETIKFWLLGVEPVADELARLVEPLRTVEEKPTEYILHGGERRRVACDGDGVA